MGNYIRYGRGSMFVTEEGLSGEISSYQMEMLRKNQLTGLLPVQIFAINERKEYHYDAGNRLPLSEFLHQHIITGGMLMQFMESIKIALATMEEYLLDTDCLCMEPEHIYIDEKEYTLQFCYGPSALTEFEKSLLKLLQFFMEKLDYGDREGVMSAYQMYQNVMKEGYTSVFTYKIVEQQTKEQEVVFPWEEQKEEAEDFRRELDKKKNGLKIPLNWIIYVAGIILCGAAAGFCYWQQNLLLCGGVVLLAAAVLYILIYCGRHYKGIDSSQNTW